MTTHQSTRRAILAGAASVPVTAVALASHASSTAIAARRMLPAGDDPIFAAIKRCRVAETAFDADPEGPSVGLRPAREALARTVATTPAGLAALTGFLREQSNKYDTFYFDGESDEPRAFGLSLDDSVRGLTGLVRWSPAVATDDLIFAAIEQHRRLFAAQLDAIHRHSELEETLPREVMRSRITAYDDLIVETDDPRWIAAEREVSDGWDAVNGAGCELTNVQPTTPAGLVALLRYAGEIEADEGRAGVPDALLNDDDANVNAERGAPFAYFILQNAARAIEQITAAA